MKFDYDTIVVGARCAGASTAMLLARRGHRVLLVDRSRFPSEVPHGHFIHRHGPPRLARWGLLDQITASGCPPVTRLTSDFGDFGLVADNLVVDDVAWGYGPRRAVLDKILVDAAVGAGAELSEGVAVDGVLSDGDAVTGIVTNNATRITSRLTIGADGKHSCIARAVKAPLTTQHATLACWYFTYYRDVPDPRFEMHLLPQRRAIFAHPTNDGLLAAFVGWPIDEFARVRADPEAAMLQTFDIAASLGERIRAGKRVERIYGSGDLPNVVTKPFGNGWALVGDAGCHKDPFLAMGVCDALRDAELLADAAHAGLSNQSPMAAALAAYEARRNAVMLPDFEENLRAAQFRPLPDDVLRMRRALRGRPDETRQFVLASYGRIPREEFFSPSNLERLMAEAA